MIIVVGGAKLIVKFTILSPVAFNATALEYDSRNICICGNSTPLVIDNTNGCVFSYIPTSCRRSVNLIMHCSNIYVHNDATPFSLSLKNPNLGWSIPVLYTFSKRLYRDKCLDRFVELVSRFNNCSSTLVIE